MCQRLPHNGSDSANGKPSRQKRKNKHSMQATRQNVQLYSLAYSDVKTYLFAAAFIIGNIALPQLCHLIPQGGFRFLPIYFFTLIAAYKYGWRVGLLTALASPILNSLLFGMPAASVLPSILIKSTLLVAGASFAASRFHKASLGLLVAVVAFYQVLGTLAEWAICGSFYAAIQDFRIGLPGMLLQIVGGWLIINRLIRK